MRVNTSLPLWVSVFLRPMVSTMTVISPTPTTMMRRGKHQQRPINHRDQLEPVWLRRCGNGLANPLDYTNSFLFTIFFSTESVILHGIPLGTLKIVLWCERVTRLGWDVRPAEHIHS